MRVNIYAEEITDRIEIVEKQTDEGTFTGIRFYLELPVTLATPAPQLGGTTGLSQIRGPFVHHLGDDDSAAVTFWGKRDMIKALRKALAMLEEYEDRGKVVR